ncbi:hypothetical protein CR513_12787 [Mucuna pruriens]|uniref:Uncharacterized protein n=1 Tax=Mucuna pruriens TaxID=157652 RepID=A0A371HLF9_MUCPR|nr:hypothetical protein CR513_12787 [Mucuna pruriens]
MLIDLLNKRGQRKLNQVPVKKVVRLEQVLRHYIGQIISKENLIVAHGVFKRGLQLYLLLPRIHLLPYKPSQGR